MTRAQYLDGFNRACHLACRTVKELRAHAMGYRLDHGIGVSDPIYAEMTAIFNEHLRRIHGNSSPKQCDAVTEDLKRKAG